MARQWHHVAHQLHIIIGEANCCAGFVAPRLLRSAARVNTNCGGPKRFPYIADRSPETVSIGKQEHDRRDAPGHTEHRQNSLAQVVAHRRISLHEDVAAHQRAHAASHAGLVD